MSSSPSLDELEIFDPASYARSGYPFEAWARLREEAPVHWCERTTGPHFWAITKHEDICYIGKRPNEFLSAPMMVLPNDLQGAAVPENLLSMDNPKHRPMRKLISNRFTPNGMRKLHHDIDTIAKEIIESVLAQGDEGEFDFVEKIAAPLPIAVIAWLLGVPREDWNKLFDWTNRIIGAADPDFSVEGEDSNTTANNAIVETFAYFGELIDERMKNPADDLISHLAHAEIDGVKLGRMELLGYCGLIMAAGNETTRNATTGGMLAFIENPDQRQKLRAEPGLLSSAIEEVVRWTSPIIHFGRTAAQDCEIRGQRIEKGQHLALFYPSANRDADIFDAPERFRIDRNPNRHIGFGIGEHFCAGAHIARLEIQMAYQYLLPQIEEIELTGPPARLHSTFVGGIKRLPIRYRLKRA